MIKKIKHLPKSFKIGLFILVLISGAYVSSWALGYGQNNNSDGLVLDITLSSDYYTAGTKTFSDQSGNSNNGVSANNAVFAPDKDGKSEGAMRFNGSSDYVIIDKSGIVSNPSELTIAAWFKKDGDGDTYECVLHQSSNTSIGASSFWLGVDASEYFTATIGAMTGVGWSAGRTNIQPVAGEWNHLLATWDGSTVRVYLNGEYIKQYALSSYSSLNTPIRMGASGNTSYRFNGSVKNALIYDRYFSAEEVKKLYGDSKPKIQASSLEKGLVGYWPLDGENYNSNTNRVTDKSAYSNHGTNNGATLTDDRFGRSEGAMGFNGVNAYINAGSDVGDFSGDFTFSFWSKAESGMTGLAGVASKGPQNNSWSVRYNVSSQKIEFRIFNISTISSNASPIIGEWEHWSLSRQNNVYRWYKNGIFVNQVIDSNSIIDFGNLGIGRYENYQYWKGSLSEIRIHNRALSDTEIKSLYERDAPKISASSLQKGLVLDMPLTSKYTKGGSAGSEIMVDNSPYSHNGLNTGSVLQSDYSVFNGSSSGVSINNFPQIFNDSVSLSVWAYYNDDTRGIVFGNYNSFNDVNFEKHTSRRLRIYWNRGERDVFSPINAFALNQWNHLVFIRNKNGNKMEMWVNGELVYEVANAGSDILNTSSDFRIGRDTRTGTTVTNGSLANLKIYNRSLSATEIKSLYDQGRSQTGIILGGN